MGLDAFAFYALKHTPKFWGLYIFARFLTINTFLNMKKIHYLLVALFFVSATAYSQIIPNQQAQEQAPEPKRVETKFDKFTSTYGDFIRFAIYELPNLKLNGGWINSTTIRQYINPNTGEKTCFLRLESGSEIEAIAYDDLVKILEAIPKLKSQCELDIANGQIAEYLEMKFHTEDGFEIGYILKDSKPIWYITVAYQIRTFKNNFDFEQAFIEAKNRMESLQK